MTNEKVDWFGEAIKFASRTRRRAAKASRDLPLWLLFAAGTLAIEGYGVTYALDSAVKEHMVPATFGSFPFMGLVNAALVLTIANMAAFLFYRAAQRRSDKRKDVRQSALTPFLIGCALMTWPMTQFASGIAWERQKAVYVNTIGSPALIDAERTLADSLSDLGERADAKLIVKNATKPARAEPSFFEWLGAIFLYGCWAMTGGAGRAIEPETDAQRRRREKREDKERTENRKAEREKRDRDAERRAAIIAGIPFIGDFLRKKYPDWKPREANVA